MRGLSPCTPIVVRQILGKFRVSSFDLSRVLAPGISAFAHLPSQQAALSSSSGAACGHCAPVVLVGTLYDKLFPTTPAGVAGRETLNLVVCLGGSVHPHLHDTISAAYMRARQPKTQRDSLNQQSCFPPMDGSKSRQ